MGRNFEGENVDKHPQPEGVQTYTTECPNYSGLEYSKERNIRMGSDEKARSFGQSKEMLIRKDNRDANSSEFEREEPKFGARRDSERTKLPVIQIRSQ